MTLGRAALLLLACLLGALGVGCVDTPPTPAERATPARPAPPEPPATPAGLDEFTLTPTADGYTRLQAVRADLERYQPRVVREAGRRGTWRTAGEIGAELGALAVINGGYFDPEDRPLGLLVSAGEVLVPLRSVSWPVFEWRGGRARIVARTDFGGTRGVDEALQCGPWLVRGGAAVASLKESAPEPRAALGLDAEDRLILAATTRGGLRLAEFAKVLADPIDAGGLGCQRAMNLDGGSSTQFWTASGTNYAAALGVPVHLALVPRG